MLNRSFAPSFNTIAGIDLVHPESLTFDNGLKTFLFHNPDQELVRLEWIFNNIYDKSENPLLNTTLSAMLKEGTAQLSSAQIAEQVDFYGAYLIPEYSYDQTSLTLYVLNKHVDKLLPLIKEILTAATIPQHELDTYIQNNKQTLSISLQKNDFVARRLFYTAVFGDNRYGNVPTAQAYDAISRADLLNLYDQQILPHNCTLFIAGNVSESLIERVSQLFGQEWHSDTVIAAQQKPVFEARAGQLIVENKKDALQSAIRLGYPMINRTHPDFPAVQVVNTLLGGFFGSRLMRNIREEKGYTYSIGSAVASLKFSGFFTIASEVGVDVTSQTLTEIDKELDILCTEQAEEEELAVVKNYMLGSMLGSLESIFSHADKFKSVYFSGMTLDYYDRYAEVVKTMTTERVLEIAKQYFRKEDLIKVVVGQLKG
ncbi:Peptidase M16 inactive domain [Sphingobacterium spiritivorum]|uniref:Peptidase M16 inactive domain n=1 Tax=Sphingobacterium spiritivorum TaxID=258 RepID=A0A380CSQ8_SPHSI|nr:pitrilysin family protein [Sphingobacterium spiritivorum]SUJ28363.1 Peptidase M16 inactive domain [Sphingobacterium spiritivorum]